MDQDRLTAGAASAGTGSTGAGSTGTGWWRPTDVGITVDVRVVPNARRTEMVGPRDGALRIRVAAPAIDDRANDRLVRYLSDLFGVRRSAIRILRGRRSKDKVVQFVGLDEPPRRVMRAVSPPAAGS